MPLTDLEIWKEFFNKYNISFDETTGKVTIEDSIWNNSIILETENGHGYVGFTFVGIFNLDGSFRCYGVWE